MKCAAILLLATACAVADEKPPEVFTIGGVVVDATTKKPARRVRVVLAPSDHVASEVGASIATDNGRFQFNVPAGKYQLRAERNGMPSQTFGAQPSNSGFGIAVIAGADQKTDNLLFLLYPPGAISGKVVDEALEPVENALVQLLRSSVVAGRSRVTTFGWAYTNDLGEFRFGDLFAGSYYLAVTGRPWYATEGRIRPPLGQPASDQSPLARTAYEPVYYANTGDPRAAAPIVLNPGQEAVANFSLSPSSGFNVTVHCEGECPMGLRLGVIGAGILDANSFERVEDFSKTALVPAVPPGHYTIRVVSSDGVKPLCGIAVVDVVSSDVEVTVAVKEASKVTGTVTLSGGDPKLLRRLIVTLRNEQQNLVFRRNVAAGGTFEIPGVLPGNYRASITGVPGVFATQVTSEEGAVKDGVIEVGANANVRLKLDASAGVGRVKGFVYRNGNTAPGVLVLLIPAALPADPGYYRSFLSDSDGSFDFENVRPGDYRLFALPDSQFEYANPAVVRPYLANAKAIEVDVKTLLEEKIELP